MSFANFRLHLDVPPSFVGIPLTGSAEQVDAHIRRLAERMVESSIEIEGADEGSLRGLALFLAQQEIRLFGRFTVEDNTTAGPVLANLALAVPELTNHADSTVRENRNAVAAKLVEQYRRRHPDADARVVPLTSGPALVAQRAGDYRLDPEVTGRLEGTVVSEFRAEFQILSPNVSHLVIMTVTTNSEAGWPAVAEQALQIANSLTFEEADSEVRSVAENQ